MFVLKIAGYDCSIILQSSPIFTFGGNHNRQVNRQPFCFICSDVTITCNISSFDGLHRWDMNICCFPIPYCFKWGSKIWVQEFIETLERYHSLLDFGILFTKNHGSDSLA
jgi:hypothetical protein